MGVVQTADGWPRGEMHAYLAAAGSLYDRSQRCTGNGSERLRYANIFITSPRLTLRETKNHEDKSNFGPNISVLNIIVIAFH